MTNTTGSELILTAKEKLEKALDLLATLRDDVRVRAHLAGMEAREWFAELDGALHQQLKGGKPTQELVETLTQKLHELDTKLRARVEKGTR